MTTIPSDTALCSNCWGALTASGRSFVHVDGYYRCPGMRGFADPIEVDEIITAGELDQEVRTAYEQGREEALDDVSGDLREAVGKERDRIIDLIDDCVSLSRAARDTIIDHIRRESR